MDAQAQLFAASILGADAFRRGLERSPGLDESLLATMTNTTSDMGFAMLRAWLASWDAANITENLDSFV